MLMVESVLPGGPADGKLQPGDAIIRLNGNIVTAFLPMEEALDSSVGECIDVELDRAGCRIDVSVSVQVIDCGRDDEGSRAALCNFVDRIHRRVQALAA